MKHLLSALAAAALVSSLAPEAHAIRHRSAVTPVDPAAAGLVEVRGGAVGAGCIGTALSDRWVLTTREVLANNVARRCVGADAASTTVTFGGASYRVAALIERPEGAVQAFSGSVTPVLLYLDAALPGVARRELASSVIPPTGGAYRGLACTGCTEPGWGSAVMALTFRNVARNGVTLYDARNNQLVSSTLRGAWMTAEADLGAPCFQGSALAGVAIGNQPYSVWGASQDYWAILSVVELRPWIESAMANPPVTFSPVGTWQGAHPHWGDSVIINADGTYHRGNGDPGRWSFDGRTLVLHWTHWGPEPVQLRADGSFASADGAFTLRR